MYLRPVLNGQTENGRPTRIAPYPEKKNPQCFNVA